MFHNVWKKRTTKGSGTAYFGNSEKRLSHCFSQADTRHRQVYTTPSHPSTQTQTFIAQAFGVVLGEIMHIECFFLFFFFFLRAYFALVIFTVFWVHINFIRTEQHQTSTYLRKKRNILKERQGGLCALCTEVKKERV